MEQNFGYHFTRIVAAMADVFISYKREDRQIAERLASALTQVGFVDRQASGHLNRLQRGGTAP